MADPIAVQNAAARAWFLFTQDRRTTETVENWETGTTPDGSPCLSGQVVGDNPAQALRLFTADYPIPLGKPGDQRPTAEYRDGRVVTVWRSAGVWVELWHPEAPTPRPGPPVAAQRPARPVPAPPRCTNVRRQYANKEN
ncbi:hypothetical protein OH809_45420 (plasmid) [Streptomyces sp. NBC_00873]|uniref:hypothetical protein n=1 Tax=unclassified Streptomyces TaxID=2593676 RepID=UPI002F90D1E1|nr:hypothetical protein OH809_45420 [Streptomyces sp. NBC_00873]WTA49376.1 hypothetical protein OH821_45465 [Streptomyces sp. NBC_00842]